MTYGYSEVKTADFGVEVFYCLTTNKAVCYLGKSLKSFWHYRFPSTTAMLDKIEKTVNNYVLNKQNEKDKKNKITEAQKKLVAKDHFQIGDIILNSWGYDQTNIDYYQIIEVKNKMIVAKAIHQTFLKSEGLSSLASYVMPDKDNFSQNGEVLNLKLKYTFWNNALEVTICNPKSFFYFKKWDGEKNYCSWYA